MKRAIATAGFDVLHDVVVAEDERAPRHSPRTSGEGHQRSFDRAFELCAHRSGVPSAQQFGIQGDMLFNHSFQ
jgi:hypothetical protein